MENEALENEEISDRAFRELKFISYLKIPTKVNSKKDLFFKCLKCQVKINADRNAAINILTLGQREIACQVKVQ